MTNFTRTLLYTEIALLVLKTQLTEKGNFFCATRYCDKIVK